MTTKQLESLRTHCSTWSKFGQTKEPDLHRELLETIFQGGTPKLRTAAEIVAAFRRSLAENRYRCCEELKLSAVFAGSASYHAKLKDWRTRETARKVMVRKFERAAERIMVGAMAPDADFGSVYDQLRNALQESGLTSLPPDGSDDE